MFLGQNAYQPKDVRPFEGADSEWIFSHSFYQKPEMLPQEHSNVLNLSTSFSGERLPWPKKLLAESDHKNVVENLEKFLKFGATTKF